MRDYVEFIPIDRPNNKIYGDHITKLKTIESFEDKVTYWISDVKLDLFKQLRIDGINDTFEYLTLLPYERSGDKDAYIYKLLIKNYIDLKPAPIQIRNEFLETCEGKENLELPKKRYLEIIGEIVNSDRVNSFFKRGYKAFKGNPEMDFQIRDLIRTFYGKLGTEHDLRDVYSGYLYAIQEEFIRDYPRSTEEVDKRSHHKSPTTAALLLKHLGIVEQIALKQNLSNEKVIELLSALFDSNLKTSSIASSYRDKQKSNDSARSKALKVLQKIGTTETMDTFLTDWKKK